jgi:hypothetical protein
MNIIEPRKYLLFNPEGNEDVYHLKWMHLHRGEPKRCYCGMRHIIYKHI